MRAELALALPAAVTGPVSPGDALLEAKFDIPDEPRLTVARPRLLGALQARTDTPVTLVVGPAGSGKTQLVASWARTTDAAVAWMTLDSEDGDSSAFWAYVVSALHRAGVSLPAELDPLPSPAPVGRSFLWRLAAELAGRRTPVLLVLDGVSAVQGEHWAADLEFVLRHAGPMVRLVLTGRWDPPLPLHRYRLAGRLTEIRSGDLAFTAGEAAELLDLHGVDLSPAGLATLLAHTEGWAAGIRLFALALQDHGDADRLVDSITGNEATIAEYFVDEVLRVQPPHVRAFLLDTSVLDTFTPDLAEAVTGRADARRLLAQLARRNAFVQPVTEHSAAYRFHRLFAELLRAQLMCESPQRVSDLHRRAANWLAARGRTVEAVGHAVKARDWPLAATIAIEHHAVGRLVTEGRHSRLGALLERLPDDCDNAEVSVVTAALALADGSVEECARQLARAQLLVIGRDWDYSPALALTDSILGVLLMAARGDQAGVLALSPATEQALTTTPREVHVLHPELRALVTAARGIAQSHVGDVDAAVSDLTEVIAETAPACRALTIDCRQHLALIEAWRGRLRHAERLATDTVDAADAYGRAPRHAPALARSVLAWVALEHNDVDAAERHLRVADTELRGRTDSVATAAAALVRARRLQDHGDLRGAVGLIEETFAATAPALPGWLARELTVARGQLVIVAGRPGKALELVERYARPHPPEVVVLHAEALAAAGEPARAGELLTPLLGSAAPAPAVRLRAWLARARVADQLGDAADTRNALRHALRAATPQGHRRAVRQAWMRLRRDVDDELAGLYRALQDHAPAGRRRAGRTPDAGDLVIVEALSRRELEVLQGMAAMTPTEEIAATLNVSVNTVKTHVRSILRKLSASRRNEAVRRARSLGLIGDLTHPGGTR